MSTRAGLGNKAMSVSISFIIPAYNEAPHLQKTLAAVNTYAKSRGFFYELILVDDGSTDETLRLAQELSLPKLRVLHHPKNLGKGAAVQTGMLAATQEYALFLDADLSTPPEAFDRFIPALSMADMLIGSRSVSGKKLLQRQPLWRVALGKSFNFVLRLATPLPYRDTQCGFKCFNRNARVLFKEQILQGWSFDAEILLRARLHGFSVKEIGVPWSHQNGSRVQLAHIKTVLHELTFLHQLARRR